MKMLKKVFLLILSVSGFGLPGDLSIGADLVSRYVWRGSDFGNAAAVQPSMSYSAGNFEIGAWSSWAINGAITGNENDLSITYSKDGLSVTLSDYFFPAYSGNDNIDKFGNDGAHVFEAMVGCEFGKFDLLATINIYGADSDHSKYAELDYNFYSKDETNASFFIGAGDFLYVANNNFNVVNVGISASRGKFTTAYIINPDQKTSFFTITFSL
ncbi:MAG: hypothetical protein JXQ65_00030 [Candidatus Marinimicrobia bacterium]|nr:hypothetical protein [Candidatus Neomarinimicrobiota bacterium]